MRSFFLAIAAQPGRWTYVDQLLTISFFNLSLLFLEII